ncbi:Methyl-accepting chemotaxis protein [Paramagnetospirillum magnetotacticum MS-1]|uniref:Methyl-accepting chemotaxis protein n=1 Tax=Paramagnetospirillum magnetotacticum MS-1 TaxID=272627 RepID=A0A0C2YS13_PARME|nr:Methyl-accepting chemotaxis protein [Paramagnetospirillum magnetotacticum MS-1]
MAAALSLLALFLALALFDAAPLLPFWLHAALAPVFALAIAVLLWKAWRVERPSAEEVARRLERDSHVAHRPLAMLADRLATGDGTLWQAHRARMEREALGLRPGWPDPVLPARDPLGLRFAVLLLLIIAAAGARSDLSERLARAVDPYSHRPALDSDTLEVWIVPPAYTGLGQTLLKPGQGAVTVPAGSRARAVTSWRGWTGSALSAGGDAALFAEDGRAELVLKSGPSLDVRLGLRMAASWPITLQADQPPSIAITQPPKGDERGRLLAEVEASDDYGLTRAWIEILPVEGRAEPLRLDLTLPRDRPRQARLSLRADLADHDWAGAKVRLTFKAEDGAGQVGETAPVETVLPEREFRNVLARALISWRKQLSAAPRQGPEIAEELRQILGQPDAFGGDERVFLALSVTRHMLMGDDFERDRMRSLLWYAATRLEDGGLPAAEKTLEEARDRLDRALADKADPAELARLVEQLRAAMEQWMEALAELGLEESIIPPDGGTPAADLAEMLDHLRGLAETGNREGLRHRLEQLSRMLAEMGTPRKGRGADPAAAEAMRRLRDLTQRQQDLLDRSFRKAPPPDDQMAPDEDMPMPRRKPSARETAEARKDAAEQKALRQALEQLAKSMPQPPDSLAEAQRSMRGAESSLSEGEWGDAAEQQAEAVKRLQDGARQMMERMEAAQGKGSPGLVPRDPFGRALNGSSFADDGRTKVPGRSDTMRAREILQELRRRSGDTGRPEPERDYLKRLLKPY